MHRLKTELSETQKLNQSLQQSNDDLRNRNGLMSRSEQEQIEKEIEDDVIDFFRIPFMWYIRFCEWLPGMVGTVCVPGGNHFSRCRNFDLDVCEPEELAELYYVADFYDSL